MNSKSEALLKKQKYLSYFFIFFVVFVPQGICAIQAIPYSTYDEIGPLKFLGFIAGESNLGTVETAYYGWGTYIWMFPVYFITGNPIYRYRALCMYSGLLQSLSAVLTFIICHKYLMWNKRIIYSICISVMVGYISSHDIILYNEHGLLLVSCLIVLFICKAFSDEKYRKNYIFGAYLVAFYGLTMHTRAIMLVIAMISISLVYYLFFKIKLLSKKMILSLVVIGICIKIILNIVQQEVWIRYSNSGNVGNVSINLGGDKIKCIFDFEFWKTMWIYCYGQMYALNIVLGGAVVIFGFAISLYVINNRNSFEKSEIQRNIFVILIFGMCTVAMMIGVGMSWGTPIYRDGLDLYGTNSITLKGINYTRYSLNYIVPLCIVSLSLWVDNSIYKKKYEFYCIVGQELCFLYWYEYIYPKVKNSVVSADYLIGMMHREPNMDIPYERLFVILFITLNIIILSSYINQKVLYFLFLDGLLIYSFMGSFYCDTLQYEIIRSEYQRASYEYLTEKLTDEEFESIDRIYAYNVDALREQFYISKIEIVDGLPDIEEQDVIIMYHGDYFEDLEFLGEVSIEEYNVYVMAEKCYLLAKGRYKDLLYDG